MVELNGAKKAIIPTVAVVTILLGMFGWMRLDIQANRENTITNAQSINDILIGVEKINGKQDTMLETLRWIEKRAEEYREANQTFNLGEFIGSLTDSTLK